MGGVSMSSEIGQRLRLISSSPIAREFEGYIIDCQARGLSPRTIQLFREKSAHWRRFFEAMGIEDVSDIRPLHIRQALVELTRTLNPGGVHVLSACSRPSGVG